MGIEQCEHGCAGHNGRAYRAVCSLHLTCMHPQEPEHDWQQPRVSPYRLAAHLVSAFSIFATLAWTAMDMGWVLWAPLRGAWGLMGRGLR